jgi:hypothetical protein
VNLFKMTRSVGIDVAAIAEAVSTAAQIVTFFISTIGKVSQGRILLWHSSLTREVDRVLTGEDKDHEDRNDSGAAIYQLGIFQRRC